jgi:DNA gyrase inhibitor GyrI
MPKMPYVFVIALVACLLAVLTIGCQATRAGYESAPYKVVQAKGRFEVRDYPALTVVETPTNPEANGSDGSFNRLFQFITGRNASQQKIPMTTPVFMSGAATNATMAFVMPAKMKANDVPAPANDRVHVRQIDGGRFAVLRYKGRRDGGKKDETLQQLRAWMTELKLAPVGEPVRAYFDPPWIPGFLRRNEVMLRVASQP